MWSTAALAADAADDAPPADAQLDALLFDARSEAGCTPACTGGEQCCSTGGNSHCHAVTSPHPSTGRILFVLSQADCEAACSPASTCGRPVGQRPSVRYATTPGSWAFLGLVLDDTCPYYFGAASSLAAGDYVYQLTCPDGATLFLDPGNSSCSVSCPLCPTNQPSTNCYSLVTVP